MNISLCRPEVAIVSGSNLSSWTLLFWNYTTRSNPKLGQKFLTHCLVIGKITKYILVGSHNDFQAAIFRCLIFWHTFCMFCMFILYVYFVCFVSFNFESANSWKLHLVHHWYWNIFDSNPLQDSVQKIYALSFHLSAKAKNVWNARTYKTYIQILQTFISK